MDDSIDDQIVSEYFEAKSVPCSNLSFLHSNIHSLKKNINNLQSCLQESNENFAVIGLTETWLLDNETLPSYYNLPGYYFCGKGRNMGHGGGVGAFIKDTLKFRIRYDLQIITEYIECFFIFVARKVKKETNLVN